MHMMAETTPEKYPGLHPPLLAGWGGGNDKLAIDKGGNLPEKVENHCSRRIVVESSHHAEAAEITRLGQCMF